MVGCEKKPLCAGSGKTSLKKHRDTEYTKKHEVNLHCLISKYLMTSFVSPLMSDFSYSVLSVRKNEPHRVGTELLNVQQLLKTNTVFHTGILLVIGNDIVPIFLI